MVSIEQIIKKLQNAYQEERNKECEELHNAIADVLTEKKATVQNTLYVLEMLRFELLRAKYEQLMGHVIVPPGGGVKRDAKLSAGEVQE